jgi:hypothetical protein
MRQERLWFVRICPKMRMMMTEQWRSNCDGKGFTDKGCLAGTLSQEIRV